MKIFLALRISLSPFLSRDEWIIQGDVRDFGAQRTIESRD